MFVIIPVLQSVVIQFVIGFVINFSLPLLPHVQAYGRDLAEAYEWCKKYQSTSNMKDLTQAWELYYHVFRRISKQLPQVIAAVLPCCYHVAPLSGATRCSMFE